jgi:hypothetical protein
VIYALAAIAVLPLVALVLGAVTGRVRVRSCCSAVDPAKDLRMRAAFAEDPAVRQAHSQTGAGMCARVDLGQGVAPVDLPCPDVETRPLLTGDTTTTGH